MTERSGAIIYPMTTPWAIAIAVNLLAYAWISNRTRCKGIVFWSQSTCVFFTVAKVIAFYAYLEHWITKPLYHWIAWAGDVSTSAGDITVAICILCGTWCLYRATTIEAAVVLSIVLHQRIKIEWHWVAELFNNLPRNETLIHYASIISNYSTLALLVMLVTAQSAHKEQLNERARKAQA